MEILQESSSKADVTDKTVHMIAMGFQAHMEYTRTTLQTPQLPGINYDR